jgi:hypothetical protein
MYTLIVVLGLVATAFFLAGFWKGVRNAVIEYQSNKPESDDVPEYNYAGIAAISVAASGLLIAMPGFSPAWIYAGPLMAIVTAAGCGLAFFMEESA